MVRPSNNFGPRQHSEKFLPTIISKVKTGQKVPVYGDGQQEREWTYVKETAKATRFILENSRINEVYNISSNYHLKNIEVVRHVCELMGKDPKNHIEYVADRPGHDFRYSVNPRKMNKLGYTVDGNFHKYIEEMLENI